MRRVGISLVILAGVIFVVCMYLFIMAIWEGDGRLGWIGGLLTISFLISIIAGGAMIDHASKRIPR
ncbi:hypothetical protein KITKAT_58 [Arthrobacter phage Kitkat]|uniref:Uncharacterized protein n=2 Tax=Kelleziovirus kitkat TaxID=1982238 RepID=A0A140G6N4_9CAUD|nr:hypothetical protein BJD77_gp058 [Arthrobacter phage Kitkat]AMM44319.1 hypothetical protein KITKAT_58 [Arthrobacter phage Kitkat]QGJ96496.1 hypothetical protein SEA_BEATUSCOMEDENTI_57 [Arthrobacter phage BeatusComedenti]